MKQQLVTQMIKDVRVILEETVNAASLEGVTDVGSISINEVIKGVLAKSVTAVASVAPMELFMEPKAELYTYGPACTGITVNKTAYAYTVRFTMPSGHTAEDFGVSGNTFSNVVLGASGDSISVIVSPNSGTDPRTDNITISVGDIEFGFSVTQTTADSGDMVMVGEHELVCKFKNYQGGYTEKPEDYLRTLYIQGDTWQRPVTILTPLSSPFVSIARSTINLSVGNVEKPLAVDSFVGGKGVIEVYPFSNNVNFVYVERPVITTESSTEYINCDDGIYHAATFYAAYLVAMIKGYANKDDYKAAAMDAIAVQAVPTNATAGAPVE